MEYTLTRSTNPVYYEIRTSGNAIFSGFESFIAGLFSHPQWESGTSVLIDHSKLNLDTMSTDDVHSISNLVIRHKDLFGAGKWAFIISGKLAFGFARMWETITEERVPMKFHIFENRESALSWLLYEDE